MERLNKKTSNWKLGLGVFLVYAVTLFLIYAKYYIADQFLLDGADGLQYICNTLFGKIVVENGGEFPFWNKWVAAGIPATSVSPILLLSWLPEKLILYVIYIGFVAAGATYFFLYLRELKCSTTVSFAVSFCYLMSIHLGGIRKSHLGIVLAVAMLPVILYYIERYFSQDKLRCLVASAAVFALQFIIGGVQFALYTGVFAVAYLLMFGIEKKMPIGKMVRHGLVWGLTFLGLIAPNILPTLEQNSFYGAAGAAGSTYEYFTMGSIHPIKLLQMIFPKIFGGQVFQAYGIYNSSEMDIELFLGFAILLLAIFGAVFYFRKPRVRFLLVSMTLTFVYCALGSIPKVGELLYRIPYINSFRCPARALFLFIFMVFVLAALGLRALGEENGAVKFRKFSSRFLVGTLLVVGVTLASVYLYAGISQNFTADSLNEIDTYVKSNLLKDLIWVTVIVVGINLLLKKGQAIPYISQITCGAVALSVLIQVYPYTTRTTASSVSELYATDPVSAALSEEVGNYKVWDAFQGIDGSHKSIISQNSGVSKNIASINSYVPFNNPYLYRLFSQESNTPMNNTGLMTGSLKAEQNVRAQNSLLSMLGVKYLIDSSNIIRTNPTYYSFSGEKETIRQPGAVSLPNSAGEIAVYQEPFACKDGRTYEIQFECKVSVEQTIHIDFYGGANYDWAEQEVTIVLKPGVTTYTATLNAGNCSQGENIVWRILSWSTEDVVLENFTITERKAEEKEYVLWNSALAEDIFINPDARDVLYVPDAIQNIQDIEDIYTNTPLYQLDRINYVPGAVDQQLSPEQVAIGQINFDSNQITAEVSSQVDTFVNFSQCFYPGWNAYVDGEKVEIHQVNGLIMGMEVPAGTHTIAFVYQPTVFWVGVGIACSTVVILAVGWILLKSRQRKKDSKA